MKYLPDVVMRGLLRILVVSTSTLMIACGGSEGGDEGNANPAPSSVAVIASSAPVASVASSEASLSSSALIISSRSSTVSSKLSVASSSASILSNSSAIASGNSSIASSGSSVVSSIATTKVPVPDLTPDPVLPLTDSPNYASAKDAVRFLAQTTFGPTAKDIDRILSIGKTAWLDEQFNKPHTKHLELLDKRFEQIGFVVQPEQDDNDEGYLRDLQRSDIWWEVALWADDQLRQRVAYSLSQILVISNVSDVLYNDTRGIANYQDILAAHAFGNYRDLLK